MDFDPLLYDGKGGPYRSIFMHIIWERLSLSYAVLLPPIAVLVFVAIMAIESNYTVLTRFIFFDGDNFIIYRLAPAEIQADATNQQF